MLPWLVLTFVLVFGAITSFEDIKFNRIRNLWIGLAMIFGVVVSLTVQLSPAFSGIEWLKMPFLAYYYLNVLLAFIFGYLLWWLGLWSAGDAKLLLGYAFIIPPIFYQHPYFWLFPALIIVINTFAPFLLGFIIYGAFKGVKIHGLNHLKAIANPRLIFSLSTFIFGFSWATEVLLGWLRITPNFFLSLLILTGILIGVSRGLRLRLAPTGIMLGIARILLAPSSFLSLSFLFNFLFTLIIFLLLRFYLLNLSYDLLTRPVFIEELKPGMMPAEDVFRVKKRGFEKRRAAYFSLIEGFLRKGAERGIFASMGDGLTEAEVRRVKRLHSKGFIKEHSIRIYDTLPFAPFMMLGALLTMGFGTDIFLFTKLLIESFI